MPANEVMPHSSFRADGAGGEPAGRHEADELEGAKILLVEDEFLIAFDLQILLYRLGCDVLGPVGSVAEALVLLPHDRPDAAILDINLRYVLVTPVIERMNVMALPFVLVTGRDTSNLKDPHLVATPALSKSVEEPALRRGLERLLHGAPGRKARAVARLRPGPSSRERSRSRIAATLSIGLDSRPH